MGRYGRRSNHWMWQPRGLDGRFMKSGGGMPQGDPEWFRRMPLWQKLLVILSTAAVAVVIFYLLPGLVIPLAIFGWLSILAGK